MQRVVVLFVGVLSVVRATPFDPDSVDRPTSIRHNWIGKVEFRNDALSEDYNIGTSRYNSNLIKSYKRRSMKGLRDLFGHLEPCGDRTSKTTVIPVGGCIYHAYGDVTFHKVLYAVDIEDVHKALSDAGLEECVETNEILVHPPKGGCFILEQDFGYVRLQGVYNNNEINKIRDLSCLFGMDTDICLDVVDVVLDRGCLMYGKNSFHLLNVLNEVDITEVKKIVSVLDVEMCSFDMYDGHLASVEPCYSIDKEHDSIHFYKLFAENNDKGTSTIPHKKVLTDHQSAVKTKTGIDILQLKFKATNHSVQPMTDGTYNIILLLTSDAIGAHLIGLYVPSVIGCTLWIT